MTDPQSSGNDADATRPTDHQVGGGSEHAPAPADQLTRRRLLGGASVGLVGAAAVGFGVGRVSDTASGATTAPIGGDADSLDLSNSVDFYTASAVGHQAGISTPQQRYCVYMTFDMVSSTSRDLQVLLARWSAAIAQCMAGRPVGSVQPSRPGSVAGDTGEALDLGPASLTVTLGLGPGLFGERFGLAAKRPRVLADLPRLPSDQLQAKLTGGDLSLQACADDPQVAYHAIRDLARMARGVANTRWVVLGFGRASAGKGQSTPRNLLGFKDGTRNIKEAADLDDYVWLGDGDDVDWMTGGTYQVARKIRMDIETWDADVVDDQQKVIGRFKAAGAPLTGTREFDTPDFTETKAGSTVINARAHIALAAHENNNGIQIMRRGFNFTDGINELGQLDAGLLFISYQNDPAHFSALQTKLGSSDLLNEYISHIGSGVFAVPPAPRSGHYFAEGLFA